MRKKRAILLLIIVTAVLAGLQFSHTRLQQDDYFHIRASSLLIEQGVQREFPWLKHTVLAKQYHDMYFLFHVLLIPFSLINPLIMAKVASILFAAVSTFVFFWFLERYQIEHSFLWTILFIFGSSSFLTRMLALRPIALASCFYILTLFILFERKHVWLSLVAYLFVLFYGAFPVFLMIVLLYSVCHSIYQRKIEWKPFFYSFGGVAAGFVVNPYFPNSLRVLSIQIISLGMQSQNMQMNLEWMPLSTWAFLLSTTGICAMLIIAGAAAIRGEHRSNFRQTLLFIIMIAFLLAYAKYARGVDQFVPFAVIFCSFYLSNYLKLTQRPGIKNEKNAQRWIRSAFIAVTVAAALLNITLVWHTLRSRGFMDNAGCARWLRDNTPAGSEVFLTNYGSFPELFFYNQHNVYSVGFDPIFMQKYDKQLYRHYVSALKLESDPYPVIKDMFNAPYIHVENIPQSKDFYTYLKNAPNLYALVYIDDFSAVFEVK